MTPAQKEKHRQRALIRYRRLHGIPEDKPLHQHWRKGKPRSGAGNLKGQVAMSAGDWQRLADVQRALSFTAGGRVVRPPRGAVIARALRLLDDTVQRRAEREAWD